LKERGEWVEAQLIAGALRRGYAVLKPPETEPSLVPTAQGARQFLYRHQLRAIERPVLVPRKRVSMSEMAI